MRELDIDLQASKQFAFLIILTFAMSLAVISCSSLTSLNKILISLIVMLYSLLIAYREFANRAVTRITVDNDGWRMGNSLLTPVRILGESTLTKWVCIIRYKSQEQRFFKKTCLVFRDSVEKEEYRRLLVALRCRRK